jgi:ABC-type uncharacterized transport system YnjBCD ATPase subunit
MIVLLTGRGQILRVDNVYGSGASTVAQAIYGSRPITFSFNGTMPVGRQRLLLTRTTASNRKLMLVNPMSQFDAINGNCCIC